METTKQLLTSYLFGNIDKRSVVKILHNRSDNFVKYGIQDIISELKKGLINIDQAVQYIDFIVYENYEVGKVYSYRSLYYEKRKRTGETKLRNCVIVAKATNGFFEKHGHVTVKFLSEPFNTLYQSDLMIGRDHGNKFIYTKEYTSSSMGIWLLQAPVEDIHKEEEERVKRFQETNPYWLSDMAFASGLSKGLKKTVKEVKKNKIEKDFKEITKGIL